jgi:TrmH family RNA methyltransferase
VSPATQTSMPRWYPPRKSLRVRAMIVSPGNETLKAIRRLRRRQGDHVLLEGPHLIGEALDLGLSLENLLVSPRFAATPAGSELLSRLERSPLEVDETLLDRLADSDSPRGVLAVTRLPRSGADQLPVVPGGIYLYLDGVQDPGNLGAVARVAEAFGAAALALAPGSVHPNHPRAMRASSGSLLRLPVAVGVVPESLDRRLEPAWMGLTAHGGDPPSALETTGGRKRRTVVLALGAEGPGLSPEILDRCDRLLTLPLAGKVESLNLAVAAGITLYALTRT